MSELKEVTLTNSYVYKAPVGYYFSENKPRKLKYGESGIFVGYDLNNLLAVFPEIFYNQNYKDTSGYYLPVKKIVDIEQEKIKVYSITKYAHKIDKTKQYLIWTKDLSRHPKLVWGEYVEGLYFYGDVFYFAPLPTPEIVN